MEKVVFLALKYTDAKTKPNLYTDLMIRFAKKGHEVYVVAPDYDKKEKKSISIEVGVNVLRVSTFQLFGNSLIQKGISNILLPYQYKRALKKSGIKLDFDLIIIPTPPITLISVATWLKKRSKAKLYLILRDIFPQNGVDLKLMSKKGLAYRYFRGLEKKLYAQSNYIGCMSPENINYIKRHNNDLDFSKLHLLRNWEDPSLGDNNEEAKLRLIKKHRLQGKIVALYGGNIGLPQQFENIIYLVETVQHLDNLIFLIIGRGTEMERIKAMAVEKELKNIIFFNSFTRIQYNAVLELAHIGLVSLNKDFTIPNYPSKATAYYKCKIPVLAAIDENTDFGKEQEKIGCGFWSVSGDTAKLKANLIKLYENKELREEMGLKGYEYMKNNLTPEHAYRRIISTIRREHIEDESPKR